MNQCNTLKQKTKLLTQNAMHFHRKEKTINLFIGHHLGDNKTPKNINLYQ